MPTRTSQIDQTSQKDIYYFITYGICFVSLGLGMSALGPMLPYLAENLDVSLGRISFLFTASSLGYLVGSAGGGRLYDRFKAHVLMVIALVLMVSMTVLIPMVTIFYLLLVIMFFFGLGLGLLDIGGNVNLLWVFQSRVGPYMNALHFSFGVGAFLSPIIIHHVMRLTNGSLNWPYWVLAVLFLPGLIGLLALKSPQNPEKDAGINQQTKTNYRLVILMMGLFFLYVGLEGGFGGWIFTYATELGIASESAASYMNSFYWGALTLGRLITIPLAKRLRPSQILFGNYGLAILSLGLILIWPMNSLVIWIGSIGLGLALSSVFPTLMALGESRMVITGGVTGLFFFGSSLGGTLVPMLLGQVFEYIGGFQVMLTLFIAALLGLVVLFSVILASNRAGEKLRSDVN